LSSAWELTYLKPKALVNKGGRLGTLEKPELTDALADKVALEKSL